MTDDYINSWHTFSTTKYKPDPACIWFDHLSIEYIHSNLHVALWKFDRTNETKSIHKGSLGVGSWVGALVICKLFLWRFLTQFSISIISRYYYLNRSNQVNFFSNIHRQFAIWQTPHDTKWFDGSTDEDPNHVHHSTHSGIKSRRISALRFWWHSLLYWFRILVRCLGTQLRWNRRRCQISTGDQKLRWWNVLERRSSTSPGPLRPSRWHCYVRW